MSRASKLIMRSLSAVLGVILVAGQALAAAQAPPPASLELDDRVTVSLAAQARRAHLLGSVDFYRLAVYTNTPIRDTAALSMRDTPKALRIDITYKHDLHRAMSFDWQRELIPHLEAAAIEQLRRIFAPVRTGDVLQIDYTLDKGTTVRVNRSQAVTRGSHDLMLAFLDHWLGQRPVSDEMKQELLR